RQPSSGAGQPGPQRERGNQDTRGRVAGNRGTGQPRPMKAGGRQARPGATMKDQPEWWGGVECTVNRVNDTYHEQLERSGHAGRLSDLERIAELGVTRLRFPVLWERTFCPRREACD